MYTDEEVRIWGLERNVVIFSRSLPTPNPTALSESYAHLYRAQAVELMSLLTAGL